MAPMIFHLSLIGKSYPTPSGRLDVLGKIDLVLGEREIVAIIGPSGCGKSTLLRIIGGLDQDYSGTLTWSNGAMPRIGTVFQEPRLLAWRSARQNVLLAQTHEDRALADSLLDMLDLSAFADAFPGALSLGMARRVAIARAFAIEPDLVLLDEPFVSLDPAMAKRGRELLLNTWRVRPTGALLVTHDRAEAAAVADRIVTLSGRPARVVEEYVVPEQDRRRPCADSHRPS